MVIKEILFYISSIKYLNIPGKYGYFLLSKLLSWIFWMSPEIRSLYLAGSMASGDIIPGLSDIDFVLVINDLPSEDEYRFINKLEARLRYLMPPLGKNKVGPHIAIYSVSEWELLGDIFLGKRYGLPKMLFEKDKIIFKHRFDDFTKALHHFQKAQWRLETLEQNISNPPKKKTDIMLRNRMMDRCFHSIVNGLNEIHKDRGAHFPYKEIKERIWNKLNTENALKEQSDISDSLPELIHFFNSTVSSCLSHINNSENFNKLMQIDSATGFNKSNALELAKGISSLFDEDSMSNSVYISRIYSGDFFLYDTADYDMSEKLIKYYSNCKERSLRILSKLCFIQLFLNHPSEPFVLIELKSNKSYQARGSYSNESYLLDAYSIFPQLRSPINYSSAHKHDAYVKKIRNLLKFSGGLDDGKSESIISSNNSNNYERFRNLKILSSELSAALNNKLEAENYSVM